MTKFNVGDIVRPIYTTYTYEVVVAEPDQHGLIVTRLNDSARSTYVVLRETDLNLVPKRYVVELRPPLEGERFFTHRSYDDWESNIATCEESGAYAARAVIVDELA
jgi:hypothetical protein